MESPSDSHWKVGKIILRYIEGTFKYGIWYTSSNDNSISWYINNDFSGIINDWKSISSYVCHLGICWISWACRKQPIMTISSPEEEYVATTSTSCHVVWLRRILNDFKDEDEEPNPMYCDKNTTIALSKNHVFHRKRKHIDNFYHFIHVLVNNGQTTLKFCGSKHWLEDIFTKALAWDTLEFQRQHLVIICVDEFNGQN